MSPVPGGRSTTSTSSSPQSVSRSSWRRAEVAIGPRQTTAWSGVSMEPIDMALRPIGLVRREDAVVADGGLALEAEQLGDRGAVEIGVEDADAQALGGKRQREVDRDGGLADAALAGADGDDVADAGDGVVRRRAGPALRLGLAGRGLARGPR